MSTKRTIGTISFNSEYFLAAKCNKLIEDELIQSYAYIKHNAEEDTKKEHYHLLLVPSCPVDPCKVRKRFIEPCPEGDLICLPFVPSKLGDWLLYALHYPVYLTKKGLVRRYHYSLDDIITNEPIEWLEDVFHTACEELTDKRISQFLDRVNNGDSFGDILSSGLIPYNQIIFYDKLYHNYNPVESEMEHSKLGGKYRRISQLAFIPKK